MYPIDPIDETRLKLQYNPVYRDFTYFRYVECRISAGSNDTEI